MPPPCGSTLLAPARVVAPASLLELYSQREVENIQFHNVSHGKSFSDLLLFRWAWHHQSGKDSTWFGEFHDLVSKSWVSIWQTELLILSLSFPSSAHLFKSCSSAGFSFSHVQRGDTNKGVLSGLNGIVYKKVPRTPLSLLKLGALLWLMLLIFKSELALDFFCFIEIVSFSYRMELTKGL